MLTTETCEHVHALLIMVSMSYNRLRLVLPVIDMALS